MYKLFTNKPIKIAIFGVFISIVSIVFTLLIFGEPEAGKKKLHPGLTLDVQNLGDHRKAMVLAVDITAPGIMMTIREPVAYDELLTYRLLPADCIRLLEGWDIVINATRYWPEAALKSYPGRRVENIESLFTPYNRMHDPVNSGVIWWSDDGEVGICDKDKDCVIPDGIYGLGLQGIQIQNGQTNEGSLIGDDEAYDRTFIGYGKQGIVHLIVVEEATARELVNLALEVGVYQGGQLDSGNSSNMILSNFRGLRSPRPIGAAIGIKLSEE